MSSSKWIAGHRKLWQKMNTETFKFWGDYICQYHSWWYSIISLIYKLLHVWAFCCVINKNKFGVKRQFSTAMGEFLCWQFSEPDINHPDMWDPLCNRSLQTSQILPVLTERLRFVIFFAKVLDCWFKLDETLNLMPSIRFLGFCCLPDIVLYDPQWVTSFN